MRKFLCIIPVLCAFAALFLVSGCESAKTVSYGKADVGYVQFVSATKYSSVKVVFDDSVTITARVNSSKDRIVENDSTYSVTPGAHAIEVFDKKGDSILKKKIFVSAQEIRTVELP